jgi:electron-transferring-flavoprotein dehydrogenase
MLAAETAAEALQAGDFSETALSAYEHRLRGSWVHDELYGCRNFRQAFQGGLISGMIQTGMQLVTGGRGVKDRLTTRIDPEHMLKLSQLSQAGLPAAAPPPVADDPEHLAFSKLTSVFHSGTTHEENQPCHLHVADTDICRDRCAHEYGNPCQYFCPASVYEMVPDDTGRKRLQINFTNCVHCKTCDIMDPYQVINWVTPEGGGGPNYTNL